MCMHVDRWTLVLCILFCLGDVSIGMCSVGVINVAGVVGGVVWMFLWVLFRDVAKLGMLLVL